MGPTPPRRRLRQRPSKNRARKHLDLQPTPLQPNTSTQPTAISINYSYATPSNHAPTVPSPPSRGGPASTSPPSRAATRTSLNPSARSFISSEEPSARDRRIFGGLPGDDGGPDALRGPMLDVVLALFQGRLDYDDD